MYIMNKQKLVPQAHVDTNYKNTNKKDFVHSLMYQIHTMNFLTEKHLEKKLSENSPLTFSQFVIMMGVQCQTIGSTTQSMLADFLHMTEATISRHIGTLEKDGLVTKEKLKENKKMKILVLTEKGVLALAKTETIIKKELDKIFAPLSTEDTASLIKYFDMLLLSLLPKNK